MHAPPSAQVCQQRVTWKRRDMARIVTKYDVIISGLGPVGAVTANLLAQYGLHVAVFERDLDVYNLGPRAVAIDAEAMRVFGMIGLDDWLDSHVNKASIGVRTGVPPRGVTLVSTDPDNYKLYGYQRTAFFNQPCVEKMLRDTLERHDNVKVNLGCEVVADTTDGDGVLVKVRNGVHKATETYRCKYMLVCEGGRSSTRKRHGLKFLGSSFKQKWLVLDTVTFDSEIKETLKDMWYISNKDSTMLLVPLPGDTQRFEFLLKNDTDSHKIVQIDEAACLIEDIGIDPNKLYFKRRIVYTFHARQIENWYDGNVVFLGDAAHCMPPFAGQGLCSGIRDAGNLAWKISLAIKGNLLNSSQPLGAEQNGNVSKKSKERTGPSMDSHQLLRSYEIERSTDVYNMTQRSINIGWLMMIRNPFALLMRNLLLILCQLIGLGRSIFEKPTLRLRDGIFDASSSSCGTFFIQPQVFVESSQTTAPLDRVLGHGFALLCYDVTPRISTAMTSSVLQPLNFTLIKVLPKRFISICMDTRDDQSKHKIIQIVDVKGDLQKWFRRHRGDVAIIRPDRFVYGCGKVENLAAMLEELGAILSGKRPLQNQQMTSTIKWQLVKTLTGLILVGCVFYWYFFT